ncbi:MAG: sodium:solute symporter, partial [Myxococcota bacterium]
LGIFMSAFFVSRIGSRSVLVGAVAGQVVVLALFVYSDIGFLWYNLVGALVVALVALSVSPALPREAGA